MPQKSYKEILNDPTLNYDLEEEKKEKDSYLYTTIIVSLYFLNLLNLKIFNKCIYIIYFFVEINFKFTMFFTQLVFFLLH